MKTRAFVACALVGALALAPLAACAGKQAGDEPASTQKTEQVEEKDVEDQLDDDQLDDDQPANEQLAGGWTSNAESVTTLTTEEQEIFAKASERYTGVDLEPVAVLATQLVAGTNYAYLCKATTVTADPTTHWVVAVVYNNLEGDATITNVEDIELADIEVADDAEDMSELVGAWEIRALDEGATLPEGAEEAFNKALQGYAGVTLKPIALLGTQVVAGTNYLVLCQGAPVVQDPKDCLYVAKVYEDLEGNAQFAEVQTLDLLEYV